MIPSYASYKSSDLEWLGQIPAHWETERLANQFVQAIEPGRDELPILSVSIHSGVSDDEIDPENMERMVVRSEDRTMYRAVRPGDLVYNMMRAWQGGFGTVAVSGMVSPAYIVARPREKSTIRTDFVEALLRTPQAVEEMRRHSLGVTDFRLRLYWDEFKNLRLPVPPPNEQVAIMHFLERETGKIDALVAEQKRLIELLKEKRQAVISDAVTKGLRPNVPMKDSGIEWLGEVPRDWIVSTVGRLSRYLSYGFTNPMPTADNGPFLLTANDVQYGSVNYENARRTTNAAYAALTAKSRPIAGDILITKDGTLGRIAVHDGSEACINQSVALLRPDHDQVTSEFLAFALLAGVYQNRMLYEAGGTTIKHIYISRLAKMPFASPSLAEQAEILRFLVDETQKFDTLVSYSQQSVALLQERRSALRSAVQNSTTVAAG